MSALIASGRLLGLRRILINVLTLDYKGKIEDLAVCLSKSEISEEDKKKLFIELFTSAEVVENPNITLGDIRGMMRLVDIHEFSICIKAEPDQ